LSLFLFSYSAALPHLPSSLHDALPIWHHRDTCWLRRRYGWPRHPPVAGAAAPWMAGIAPRLAPGGTSRALGGRRCALQDGARRRSEEHTSELQSPDHLVCCLLLEKKKK